MGRDDRLRRFILAPAALALVLAASAAAQMGPPLTRGGRGGRGLGDRAVVGEVTDINPVKGYIQVSSFPDGVPRVIVTAPETEMTKDAQVPIAELKVGDQVTVAGVPIHLAAVRIGVLPPEEETPRKASPPAAPDAATSEEKTKADTPKPGENGDPKAKPGAPVPSAPRPIGGMMSSGPMGPHRPGGDGGRSPGEWSAAAVVKALDPLTIELEGGQTVTLTVSDTTEITRPKPATIQDVQVGDVLGAVGRRNDDGYLQAEKLFIGPDARGIFRIVMREVRRMPRPTGLSELSPPADKPDAPAPEKAK